MTNLMIDSFFGDKFLDTFFAPAYAHGSNYPAVNVYTEKDSLVFEYACAGFSKDNIQIEVNANKLTVSASKEEDTENKKYLVRKFAKRSFNSSYILPDGYIDTPTAEFVDGTLKITFQKNIEDKKKLIEIK